FGMLRNGWFVWLRKGTLRDFSGDRRTPAFSCGRKESRGDCRRPRYFLPSTGRTCHRPAPFASGRGAGARSLDQGSKLSSQSSPEAFKRIQRRTQGCAECNGREGEELSCSE